MEFIKDFINKVKKEKLLKTQLIVILFSLILGTSMKVYGNI